MTVTEFADKSKRDIANHFLKKGGSELICFDLEKYKGFYFKDIHTYNEEQFKKYIEKYLDK